MFQGTIDLDTATPVNATTLSDVLFERGLYWASGRSGVVNLVAAHKWFNLAALKGRSDAIVLRREVESGAIGIAIARRELAIIRDKPAGNRSTSRLFDEKRLAPSR